MGSILNGIKKAVFKEKEDKIDKMDILITGVQGKITIEEKDGKKRVLIKITEEKADLPKEYY